MEMKLWDQALQEALEQTHPLSEESLPLKEAIGRYLREGVCANADIPAFDLSMMDGYAVREECQPGVELHIPGATAAGEGAGPALAAHEARRIFTGAPLPPGATRVIPQEETKRLDERKVRIMDIPSTSFVRPRGSEAKKGDVILRQGQKLGPTELAILAGLGHVSPKVGRRPRIAHFALGDELVDPAETPAPGKIRDTNSTLIRALLEQNQTELLFHRRLADHPLALESTIKEMGKETDVLLLSGGASVGDHDHARPALRKAGFTFLFEKIHFRPGKPTAVARRDHQIAICIPGNPVSHLAIFYLIVQPILRKLAGAKNPTPLFDRARLCAEFRGKSNPRHTFWPAIKDAGGIHPLRFLSSGDMLSLAGVNAFISLPPNTALPSAGSEISFLSLD